MTFASLCPSHVLIRPPPPCPRKLQILFLHYISNIWGSFQFYGAKHSPLWFSVLTFSGKGSKMENPGLPTNVWFNQKSSQFRVRMLNFDTLYGDFCAFEVSRKTQHDPIHLLIYSYLEFLSNILAAFNRL